jgi:chromosome partitioning protein
VIKDKGGDTVKVISIVAQKGGTGKTTTAMTIAGYLSGKGKKTLVIDFNEQGDLSDTLGAEAQTSGAGEVLKGAYIENVAQKTNLKNVDILTGAENLAMVEREISITGTDRALILKKALKKLGRKYDYVVIDAPGAFNTAFLNALATATSISI